MKSFDICERLLEYTLIQTACALKPIASALFVIVFAPSCVGCFSIVERLHIDDLESLFNSH